MDRVLLVSNQEDLQTDDMVRAIERLGEEPVRLNTDEVPLETLLELEFDGDWAGRLDLLTSGRTVDVRQVRSVWWRRPSAFRLPDDLDDWEREIGQARVTQALRGLWSELDCWWMDHPDAVDDATWKLEQLRRAVEAGFAVPRTLVTSDPAAVRAFAAECGRLVWKPMSGPYLAAHRFAFHHPRELPPEYLTTRTTLVTDEQLDRLDGIRLVPSMFQELVPKRVEYRVTVVDGDVYAAEIDSQAVEATLVDSRGTLEVPYRAAVLPEKVARRCSALVTGYGLRFSALDLVLTPDERWVFLENNPVGQFGHVEDLVPEFRLTEAIARSLVRAGRPES